MSITKPPTDEPPDDLTDLDDQALLARLTSDIERLTQRNEQMALVLRPASALTIAGFVQLALKHPAARRLGRAEVATEFLRGVRFFFSDAPAVLEVLRRGELDDA